MSKRTGIEQEKQAYVNQVGLLASKYLNLAESQDSDLLQAIVFLGEMLTQFHLIQVKLRPERGLVCKELTSVVFLYCMRAT